MHSPQGPFALPSRASAHIPSAIVGKAPALALPPQPAQFLRVRLYLGNLWPGSLGIWRVPSSPDRQCRITPNRTTSCLLISLTLPPSRKIAPRLENENPQQTPFPQRAGHARRHAGRITDFVSHKRKFLGANAFETKGAKMDANTMWTHVKCREYAERSDSLHRRNMSYRLCMYAPAKPKARNPQQTVRVPQ